MMSDKLKSDFLIPDKKILDICKGFEEKPVNILLMQEIKVKEQKKDMVILLKLIGKDKNKENA
jgi:hypothetical protein